MFYFVTRHKTLVYHTLLSILVFTPTPYSPELGQIREV